MRFWRRKKTLSRWTAGAAFALCVLALAALLASAAKQRRDYLFLQADINGSAMALDEAYHYSGALTLTVRLPEWESRWRPMLEVNATNAAEVFLDGERLGGSQAWDGTTLGNAFYMLPKDCAGRVVTVKSSKKAGEPVPFLYLTDLGTIQAITRANTAGAALPAAAFGMMTLFTLGLFFYSLAEGNRPFPVLLLSLASLGQTLYFYAVCRVEYTISPQLYGLILSLSRAILFAFPSLYLLLGMKKQRRLFLPFAVLPALIYFMIGGFQTVVPAFSAYAYRIGEVYYVTAAMLIVCAILEYRDKNPVFCLFVPALALSSAGIGAACLLSWLRSGWLFAYLQYLVQILRDHQPDTTLYWWNVLLLLLCFLISVLQQLQQMVAQETKLQMLSAQKSMAQEQLAAVMESADSLRRMRHETVNHYTVLQNLSRAGEWNRLEQYVSSLLADADAIPAIVYAAHPAINAVLISMLARAKKQGVKVSCQADVPQELPFSDTDLCTVLMNLLQNALDANALAPDGAGKWLHVDLHIRGAHLYIGVENARFAPVDYDGKSGVCRTTKPDRASHGYGLPAAQSVAHKYQSELLLEFPDGKFLAATALQMPK